MDTTQISLKKVQLEIRKKAPVCPHLWTIAGDTAGSGCTTVARVMTELLRRNGQEAEFVSADTLFAPLAQPAKQPSIGSTYHVLPIAFVREITKILLHTSLYRYNFDENNEFLIFDMGTHISAHTVDLFLIADLPILLMHPDERGIDHAKRFFKICLLKILDAFFDADHHEIRAVIADLEEHAPFSSHITRRIKNLRHLFPTQAKLFESFMRSFTPRLLLNHGTPEKLHKFSEFFFREASTAFPPGAAVIGTLPEFQLLPQSTVHLRTQDGNRNDPLDKIERVIRRKMSQLIHAQN